MNEHRSTKKTLEASGWIRQFVANEPRLSEAVELYTEAGFDVHLEPLPKEPVCEGCSGPEDEEDECRICFEGSEDQYKTIYTKPNANKPQANDELF